MTQLFETNKQTGEVRSVKAAGHESVTVIITPVEDARLSPSGRKIDARYRVHVEIADHGRLEYRNDRQCITSREPGSWTISAAKLHGKWILGWSQSEKWRSQQIDILNIRKAGKAAGYK